MAREAADGDRAGWSATLGRASITSKNCASFGDWLDMKLTKLTICPSRPISMVARLMNATIWPTVVNPRISSQTPVTSIATSSDCRTRAGDDRCHRPPCQDRHLRSSASGRSGAGAPSFPPRSREALDRGQLPSTSETRSATWFSVVHLLLHVSVRRTTSVHHDAEHHTRTIRIAPSRQLTASVVGNSTRSPRARRNARGRTTAKPRTCPSSPRSSP